MTARQRRRLLLGLGVGLVVGLTLSVTFWFNLLSGLQRQGTDLLFKARVTERAEQEPAVREIVIIGIDEPTLRAIGRWPFPRDLQGQFLQALAQLRPRVIVLDIGYFEPSPGDEIIVQAIADAKGNRIDVILPVLGYPPTPRRTQAGQPLEFEALDMPLEPMARNAAAIAHANTYPDEDGTVRQMPLLIRVGGQEYPSLALAAVAKFLRRPEVLESEVVGDVLPFAAGQIPIPIDPFRRMNINYLGGPSRAGVPSTFRVVSYVDIVEGRVDPAIIRDKIVLVGAMAGGLLDDYWTPVSTTQKMFGVEIHASAIATILKADFLRPQGLPSTVAAIVILSLFAGLLLPQLAPLWAFAAIFGVGAIYFIVALYSFDQGVIFNLVYPILALILSIIATSLYRILFEEADRREVNRLFGRYVSPQVRDQIVTEAESGRLRLGGERHEVSVMFADIRGFTSLSEKLAPEAIVSLLNTYLSAMISAVFEHEGMVNKFAGDNIMAVWNAPMARPDHAMLAVRTAVESIRRVKQLQEERPDIPKAEFGIGVNTGEAVAGNMGSEDRSEYTVIGDAVNLASRLTSGAPGGSVWIGPATYERVKDKVEVVALEPQYFKGKAEPVPVYEVIGLKEGVAGPTPAIPAKADPEPS